VSTKKLKIKLADEYEREKNLDLEIKGFEGSFLALLSRKERN
jgi:hypothetical protein